MNKNDSKALDPFYSQCILNGFQTHFEWVSLVSGRISMHSQVFSMEFGRVFNWFWKESQLILCGSQCFFGWGAMHFGWISNACSMDFQLCCLVTGMLSSLRGVNKNIRPQIDCPPIGNGLAVGILPSHRDFVWPLGNQKKTSDPGEIVHLSGMFLPSGCCLVVGMLACRMHFEWVSNGSP